MPVASTTISLSNQTVQDPKQFAKECDRLGLDTDKFLGKANSFILPRGKYPGRGWVLLLKSQVDKLDFDSILHTLKFVCQPATLPLEKLCVVRAECLTGGQVIGPNDMYLVELSDRRYIAHNSTINKVYNERFINDFEKDGGALSWYAASLNSGTAWTWATMIANIWTNLSFLGTLGTVEVSYPTSIPENYNFRGISAWDALNKVLDDINHTIVVTKAGGFEVIPLGTTDTQLATMLKTAKSSLQLNSQDVVAHNLRLPEKVRVYFPKHNYNFQNGTDQNEPTPQDYWRQNPLHSVDKTTTTILADVVPITGTIHSLHDSTPATYNDEGTTPSNNTDLNTRATERATKYLNDLKKSQGYAHNLYDGLHNFVPRSEVSAVSWFDTGDGIYTEILRRPSPPEKIERARLWIPTCHVESPSPPDIQRVHEPTERLAIVKLTGSLAASGKATANIQKGTYDNGTDLTTWANTSVPHQIVVHNPSSTASFTTDAILPVYYNWQVKRWIVLIQIPLRYDVALTPLMIPSSETQVTLGSQQGATDAFTVASDTITSHVAGFFKLTLNGTFQMQSGGVNDVAGCYIRLNSILIGLGINCSGYAYGGANGIGDTRSGSINWPIEVGDEIKVYVKSNISSAMSLSGNGLIHGLHNSLMIEG